MTTNSGSKRLFYFVLAFSLSCVFSSLANASQPPKYTKQRAVAGQMVAVGSDTMANIMSLWSQEFTAIYPQVKLQIQASGSSTAPPALTEGTASIGAMSRELKYSERNLFARQHGYDPLVLKVAVDAVAIFVHRDNPINALSLAQVDAIFSETRFCGYPQSIQHWQQVKETFPGDNSRLIMYGRNSVSGTYGQFKLRVLCDGDFKARVREQPGSASVVQSVASSEYAIGYAAYGYKVEGVKALAIAGDNGLAIPANANTIIAGDYPLIRFLYLVVNKVPGEPLPTLEREFLRFVLSQQGQKLVADNGYFTLAPHTRNVQELLLSE